MNNSRPNLTTELIFELLSKRFDNSFLSLKDLPHPSKFKDMDIAVTRIAQAIKSKQKIILIGDYDVDGVISTAIMRRFFMQLGIELDWIIQIDLEMVMVCQHH